MKKILNTYFSKEFLWTPVDPAKFNSLYLGLAIVLILAPIVLKIYLALKKKDRPKRVYGTFDSAWFWSSFSLGLIGLFIWFSRTQSFPFFGTRLTSYVFLLLILVSAGLIYIYYRIKIPVALNEYYEKSRKKKYLK